LWPRADYSLLDVERYFEERGERRLDYCSSRGRRDAPDWLGLRPERVAGEVVELAERYRVGELCFLDEDFYADPARVEAIAAGLVDAGAPLGWRAEARPEDVLEAGPGTLQRLVESGCRGLQLPVAGVAREQVLETAALLVGAGLGGRFVFEVAEAEGPGKLAAAVSTARTLCAMDSRFLTPIRHRRAPAAHAHPGRSLEAWAALDKLPWKDAGAQRRLRRVAFYFAVAQRTHRQAPAARAGAGAGATRVLRARPRAGGGRARRSRSDGTGSVRARGLSRAPGL
jgi:hypothetical protein